MKLRLPCAAVVFCLAVLSAPAQDKDANPFRNAKVGDFVAYKMTTKVMDKAIEGTMRQSVSEKNDKELTLKMVVSVMGMTFPAPDTKIDLTKPYDPTALAMQGNPKGKFEKTGDGKEKIKVGDKTYDCEWIKGKVTADTGAIKIESEVKLWTSKAVPLTGLVKMEMKSNVADVTMTLTKSGNEK